ncbi:MAG TPA: hypothetical protein ENJ40_09730 [Thermosulfurimonas dismutans]|uniref:Uncharacterized protein n=1 Tax=Thermosulfurimonas dismutans TaxID=999894 RepID=A0A7C3CTM7_9BACT|nr:hypothetical protein [Thermosulfurimonas dismutans]
MKMMERRWLKCRKIGEGLFPSEIAVLGRTVEGKEFTLFADESILKPLGNDEMGLQVTLLDSQGDEAVVVLPDFPFEMNRIIRVKRSELLPS